MTSLESGANSYIDLRTDPQRLEKSVGLIQDALGLRPFTDAELDAIGAQYKTDLHNGIHKAKPSSLAMYDTHLPPVDVKTLPRGKKAFVIEIGGTNIRSGYYWIDEHGKHREETYQTVELDMIKYPDADTFYAAVLDKIAPGVVEEPATLGIIWSFPGTAFKRQEVTGVDITSDEALPKEFVIPGISEYPIGQSFLERLHDRYGWEMSLPLVVLNDTRAVEGGIVGTGFNLAFGKYNTESGRYTGVLTMADTPLLFSMVDAQSEKPGRYLTEKQVAGKYLEEALNVVIEQLQSQGLAMPQVRSQKTEFITDALTIALSSEIKASVPNANVLAALLFAGKELRDRSASLVGTLIGVGIDYFEPIYPDAKVKFPIEGSVFWKVPRYQNIAQEYANRVLRSKGQTVQFVQREHAGMKGAASAALSMLL